MAVEGGYWLGAGLKDDWVIWWGVVGGGVGFVEETTDVSRIQARPALLGILIFIQTSGLDQEMPGV